MEVEFQVEKNYLVIRLPAELDHHSTEKIRMDADKLIEKHDIKTVVFDFQRTNFMDSSGIGVIMGRYKRVRFIGGKVMAVRTGERAGKILRMSGLYKIIEIHKDIPAGLECVVLKGGTV